MNFILNLLVVIITAGFVGFYLFSFILNLVRAIKMNKYIQANPDYVQGEVVESEYQKGRHYVVVQYNSKGNNAAFTETFELKANKKSKVELKELKEGESMYVEDYKKGDQAKIYYAKVAEGQKITCFPIYLEGQKMGIEKAPLIMDIAIVGAGLYILIYTLIAVLTKDATTGSIGLAWGGRAFISSTMNLDQYVDANASACFNGMYLFIEAFFYVVFFQYVLERIKGLSAEHKNQYLKLCGIKGTAEVKTFKYTKQKSNDGYKEAEIKIEYFTNKGEKINTTIYSYLYSKTEEQFITILYDPMNPNNVVYMRENGK